MNTAAFYDGYTADSSELVKTAADPIFNIDRLFKSDPSTRAKRFNWRGRPPFARSNKSKGLSAEDIKALMPSKTTDPNAPKPKGMTRGKATPNKKEGEANTPEQIRENFRRQQGKQPTPKPKKVERQIPGHSILI
jgi:hypothetical protein